MKGYVQSYLGIVSFYHFDYIQLILCEQYASNCIILIT